jgi:hypothetical protein
MSPNAGGGEGGCGVSANENSCAHQVTWSPTQIKFGDLTPYLTYVNIGTMGSALVLPQEQSLLLLAFLLFLIFLPLLAIPLWLLPNANNNREPTKHGRQRQQGRQTRWENHFQKGGQQRQGRQQEDSSHNRTPGM